MRSSDSPSSATRSSPALMCVELGESSVIVPREPCICMLCPVPIAATDAMCTENAAPFRQRSAHEDVVG